MQFARVRKTFVPGLAFASLILLSAITGSLRSQPPNQTKDSSPAAQVLINGGFEEGDVGRPPTGWNAATLGGYRVSISDEQPQTGKRSALIELDADPEVGRFGNVSQSIDVAPLRGKRVRFRAAVRTEVTGNGNRAQLWFRVDLASPEKIKPTGAFDNMGDRPIKTATWQHFEIVGDVAEDAEHLIVGMILLGKGKAWIDDASLEVVGKEIPVTAKPLRTSPYVRNGSGLYEIAGSMRLTPHAAFLRAHKAEYQTGDGWKESPLTVLVPLPLAYRDQVPLSYDISVHPPQATDTIEIYQDGENWVARLVLSDALNRRHIDIQFRSTLLIGPSSFDGTPKTAAIPSEWPVAAASWLKATWCADSDHDRIRAIAMEIRAVANDDVLQIIARVEDRAKAIYIAANGHVSNLTAVEALDKRGSCTSCGNLVAAMLRASGVPARILSGYPSWSGPLQTHYIVEAYVPNFGWYPIESTMCRSPWPNYQQAHVAIIPIEHESQDRAGYRSIAAGGVPYLSLTEMPDNPGSILMQGTIEGARNCDHVCKFTRNVGGAAADWQDALKQSGQRWREWLSANHKLSDDGKLSFGKPGVETKAESVRELLTELQAK